MIPRAGALQGVSAGLSLAVGYGIGVLISGLWSLLELPRPGMQTLRRAVWAALVFAGAVIIWGLAGAAGGQQPLHDAMGLPPVESARPWTIAAVGGVLAAILIFLGRLFVAAMQTISRRLTPMWPPRLAMLVAFLATVIIFNFIGNDLILNRIVSGLDLSYAGIDAMISDEIDPPQDPLKTGSPASLISWDSIGNQGRNRVSDPLDAAAIADITGEPAMEPIRVYVGLGSAETAEDRARLALDEAIRVGAFDRKTLVIATPTGTGWIDPSGAFPLEVLTHGDVATISVQYSYLPSWLSLLTVPEYGAESAREVFLAIYHHWRSLPRDARPKLYLFGLSLGALNSDLSVDFFDLVGDPFTGAFWVGPPFASHSWGQITADRDPGSPAWLPTFRDGAVVRFLNQFEMPQSGQPWGSFRIAYLQYGSDAITFFSPSILWREPDWMKAPRAPDVVENFRWIPVVTFLQVGFDLLTATTTPKGFGHDIAGTDYLKGWVALLSPEGWNDPALDRVRAAMAERGL
ncbi:alpha/beta-hydrolase family protein [Sedimentitalea sp. JM2-8]|uniref:Alpha/beta-hydrolase family protein n=1 Tax=Sedimentitalea xiamensis TaxID=3050037 RepID=A0ABT7FA83_9RHOB|nr:alpha/beta-hydrolase family protein [Sedimentitalea xiamensis]MDK3072006.1 alpha/beta-hydrolase family protein [Sedimentitalea xiamensis]